MTIEIFEENDGFLEVCDQGTAQVGFTQGADRFVVESLENIASQHICISLKRKGEKVTPVAAKSTTLYADGKSSSRCNLENDDYLVFYFEEPVTASTVNIWEIHDVFGNDGSKTAVLKNAASEIGSYGTSNEVLIGSYRLKHPDYDSLKLTFEVDGLDTHVLTCTGGLALHVISNNLILDIASSEGVSLAAILPNTQYELQVTSATVEIQTPGGINSHTIPNVHRKVVNVGSANCKTRNISVVDNTIYTLVWTQRFAYAELGATPKAVRVVA